MCITDLRKTTFILATAETKFAPTSYPNLKEHLPCWRERSTGRNMPKIRTIIWPKLRYKELLVSCDVRYIVDASMSKLLLFKYDFHVHSQLGMYG